jgi:predicted membrane protein
MDEVERQGSPDPTTAPGAGKSGFFAESSGGVFVAGVVGEPKFTMTGRLLMGVAVIALGVLFTLDNMGVVAVGPLLRWWPAPILLYGLARLFGVFCRPNFMAGMILTLVGAWLLLNTLDMVSLDFFGFWSIILIAVGISIVSSALRDTRARSAPGASASSSFSAFAFMSGTDRVISSQEFRGGDIVAIMGGHKIDMRPARLAGGAATIDLLVWWGGVELFVPDDWEVANEGVALMGAIEDSGSPSMTAPRERLVLRGLVLMGGVEVKRKPR